MRYALAIFVGSLLFLDLPLERLRVPPPPRPQAAPQPPTGLAPPEVRRPVVFFGAELPPARRVVYVLDYSSSMGPERWDRLQEEFARSTRNLDGEFVALLYGCSVDTYSDEYTDDAEGAIAWVAAHTVPWHTKNATGTAQAVLYALALEPDAVVLLTDGAPGGCGLTPPGQHPYIAHSRVIRERNRKPVPIHCFVWPTDEYASRFGQQVASDSGGVYVRNR